VSSSLGFEIKMAVVRWDSPYSILICFYNEPMNNVLQERRENLINLKLLKFLCGHMSYYCRTIKC